MIDGTAAAFALLLGAVAAFNPCGFALLPAYITVIVTGSADERLTRAQALRRAVVFGLAMTAGFVAVFTGFGLLFGAVNVALQGSVLPYLPYVTVTLGVVLIGFGVAMALGREVPGLRVRPVSGSRAPRRRVVPGALRRVLCPRVAVVHHRAVLRGGDTVPRCLESRRRDRAVRRSTAPEWAQRCC